MSLSRPKVNTFLSRSVPRSGTQFLQPILLSDSKGFLLERNNPDTCSLLNFECRSGVRTQPCINRLSNVINSCEQQGSSSLIYVWLGTNDISKKVGKYTEVRVWDDSIVNHIISEFRRAIVIVQKHSNCSIKFIECPPYSISNYNARWGHPKPSDFRNDDLEVARQVDLLNIGIASLNQSLGQNTLHFSNDILRRRKDKERVRVSYKYSVYYDGIHPGEVLARVWGVKLRNDIHTNCFRYFEEDILQIDISEDDLASLF